MHGIGWSVEKENQLGANPDKDAALEVRKAGDLIRGAQEHLALAHQALRSEPAPRLETTDELVARLVKQPNQLAGMLGCLARALSESDRARLADDMRANFCLPESRQAFRLLAAAIAAASFDPRS